jgi:membrane protein DedA with SNARE-associated domain
MDIHTITFFLRPEHIENVFRTAATSTSLEVFAFFGSLAEEIISPIPSYVVMGIVGTMALAKQASIGELLLLAFVGAAGKTLGGVFYYVIGDVAEDLLRGSLARLFRITPESIENFGKRFSGKHWKDFGLIFLLRFFPFTPTTPLSLACGAVKIRFWVYVSAGLLGNFAKDIGYVLIGYYGVASLTRLWREIHWYKVELEWVLGLIAFGVVLTYFFQSDIWREIKKKIWRK